MVSLKINTLFQNALRPLEPDEYERLSKSIEAEGCREPIETWHGFIIAGHNRYQICRETGQSFQVKDRDADFEDETDVLIWILDDALGRRNLDAPDKKRYIGELYNLQKVKDAEKVANLSSSQVDNTVHLGSTSENIGLKFGVSGRTVRRYGSEAEKQKIVEELKAQVFKEATREGRTEDEDWQQERFNELSAEMQGDEYDETAQDIPEDDFNQDEPTQEQRDQRKAQNPKRKIPKKLPQLQRAALNAYEAALNKIQASDVGTFCPEVMLPDFKPLYASIEAERAKLPQAKKKFGR